MGYFLLHFDLKEFCRGFYWKIDISRDNARSDRRFPHSCGQRISISLTWTQQRKTNRIPQQSARTRDHSDGRSISGDSTRDVRLPPNQSEVETGSDEVGGTLDYVCDDLDLVEWAVGESGVGVGVVIGLGSIFACFDDDRVTDQNLRYKPLDPPHTTFCNFDLGLPGIVVPG